MTEFIQIKTANAIKAIKGASSPDVKRALQDLVGEDIYPEKITDRVKSYADACAEVGCLPLTISDFSALPVKDQEATYAFHQITIIARALNEGWEPDWNNSNQYKYYPWFKYAAGGSGFSCAGYFYGASSSGVGSRLHFKTSELAEYAGKQFISIYNQFLKI